MEQLRELLINRDYKPAPMLKPWHGFILFGFFILSVGLLSIFVVYTSAGKLLMERLIEGDIVALSITSHLPLLLISIVFILATRMRWTDLKLRMLNLSDIGYAIGLTVVAFVGAMFIVVAIALLWEAINPGFFKESLEAMEILENLMDTSSVGSFVRTLIFLALFPAVLEELLYRGLMMESLMRWGPFWAILISATAFGLSHQMLLRIPGMIFVGILLGWIKYKSGKLSAAIFMHLIYNTVVVTFAFFTQSLIPVNH